MQKSAPYLVTCLLGLTLAALPGCAVFSGTPEPADEVTGTDTPAATPPATPINYAEGLEGDLLIITGTGETNTHVQIVEGLVDRLIALDKEFDYFAYPHRNHGLREGEGTTLHLRKYMMRYLLTHLPAGPR